MFIGRHDKCLLLLSDFNATLIFWTDFFFLNTQISNFVQIRPAEAELFRAVGQTDRHDEANTRLSPFLKA